MNLEGFHRIEVRNDPATGLRIIFALHNLTLGPALGGIRRWGYADDATALTDAVRLARSMTNKNALAGLPFGGGKAVIIAPHNADKGTKTGPPAQPITEPELLKIGEWIEELGGEYIATEDVGMRVCDLVSVGERTTHVVGMGRGCNPSLHTALGVFASIRVVAKRLGFNALNGTRVAVQGLGNVGMKLCELLHDAKAQLLVADVNQAKVDAATTRFRATALPVDQVLLADADIVAPCALGTAITTNVAETISARAIAGSANNQLANPEVNTILKKRGVLYAPDCVINAGGVISAGLEYLAQDGFDERAQGIDDRLEQIFATADATGEPESKIAEALANRALQQPDAVNDDSTRLPDADSVLRRYLYSADAATTGGALPNAA